MYNYKFNITRIVDGVTIDGVVDLGFGVSINQRVRLLDVCVPDLHSKHVKDKETGIAAKQCVVDWLNGTTSVVLRSHKDTSGKTNRILGELFLSGSDTVSINNILLDSNLATPYTQFKSNPIP